MALQTSLWYASVAIGLMSILVFSLVRWARRKGSIRTEGKILLITAHPDDESMFFAPTIITLAQTKVEVFLLCLSEGNHYGQGYVRRNELVKSAAVLGIEEKRVRIVDDRDLPDDPAMEWNWDIVGNYTTEMVTRHGIKTIITFDEKGVSRHPNHIAISKAVKKLHNSKSLQIEVLLLETVNILRKYSSWLDVGWTMLSAKECVTLNWAGYTWAKRSMEMHRSQYLWFRRLYVLFSRYMMINSFKRL